MSASNEHVVDKTFVKIVERNGSPNVIVAFSARAMVPGKFTFFRTLSNIDAHVIFMNDRDDRWYLFGCPDIGDVQKTTAWLQGEIERLRGPGGKVTFIGSSMGAHAAIRFGCAVKADQVLSFSPEPELMIEGGRSITSLKREWIKPEDELRYLKVPSSTKIVLYVGDSELVDLYGAALFAELNPDVKVLVCENTFHLTVKYINREYDLKTVFHRFAETGEAPRDLPIRPLGVSAHEAYCALTVERKQKAGEQCTPAEVEMLGDIAKRNQHWGLVQYLYAMEQRRAENHEFAVELFKKALVAAPQLNRARLQLGVTFRKLNQPAAAVNILMPMLKENATKTVCYELGCACLEAGLVTEGLRALRKWKTLS